MISNLSWESSSLPMFAILPLVLEGPHTFSVSLDGVHLVGEVLALVFHLPGWLLPLPSFFLEPDINSPS